MPGSPASPSTAKRNDRPTVIDGLRRQDARVRRERVLTCDSARRPNLSAHCVRCGASACDWRRLLGIGARIVESAPTSAEIVVRHPGACPRCGGSDLVVTAGGPAEAA
ncbi:MAG TPA: hypothetical protein VHS09_16945 [Polyangiaceae bacterium]|nr:hypothetical protein [Polyangiaceae bacterium]